MAFNDLFGGVFSGGAPSTAGAGPSGLLGDPMARAMLGASLISGGSPSLSPKSGFEGVPATLAVLQRNKMLQQDRQWQKEERDRQLSMLEKQRAAISGMGLNPDLPSSLLTAQYRAANPGTVSYGKSPVMGKDAQGNSVMGVVGDDGSFKQLDTGGFTPTPGVQRVDLGTAWGILGKDGSVISTIPKDIAGAETQKVVGKNEGEKIIGRDGSLTQADEMLSAIDGLITAPGRETMTGASSWLDPRNYVPGTDAANARSRLDQLQGKAFLQAFESLKGGGQITEREGLAAQNAIARLQTSQSDEEFLQSLQELRTIVMNAKARIEGREPSEVSNPIGQRTSNGSQIVGVSD